ncbi:MAG: ribosome maturation factor RimM [Pseudomonadota bacterium]
MAEVPEGMICVGAIAGSFGVRGEARIKSFCATPETIADYAPLSLEDGRSFGVKLGRAVKGGFAVRLTGIDSKEAADALKGQRLYAPRERLPNLPDDEYYHADLIGLAVIDTGGQALGRVKAIHDHGAGDLLEVTGPHIRGSAMLPFTKDAVPTVDVARGRLIADPPDGVLPEPDEKA